MSDWNPCHDADLAKLHDEVAMRVFSHVFATGTNLGREPSAARTALLQAVGTLSFEAAEAFMCARAKALK